MLKKILLEERIPELDEESENSLPTSNDIKLFYC
jgi:hypothetical protein